MFDPGLDVRYPHLMGYLRHLTRRRIEFPTQVWGWILAGLGGAGAVVGGLFGSWPGLFAGAFAALVGLLFVWRGKRALEAPEDPRLLYAREVASLMLGLRQHQRLHRDLSADCLTLMNEAARQWERAQRALGMGTWADPYRMSSLSGLRDRMAKAADEGMADLLALYRPYLPSHASSRPIGDWISEGVDMLFPGRNRPERGVPPCYWDAREVAEKMRLLADEAERISLHGDPQANVHPGQAIEAVLGEIQARGHAEAELDATVHERA